MCSSDLAHPYQMQFVVGLTASFALGSTLVIGDLLGIDSLGFIMPTATEWEWIIYMGLVATIGHIFIVLAATNAPASVLAPFQYIEIVSTVFLGYMVFGDIPAASTVIGVSIIVVSGVYLFNRERMVSRRPSKAA